MRNIKISKVVNLCASSLRLWLGIMALCCLLAFSSADAVNIVVDLGGGWQASWDESLDNFVDVTNALGEGVVLIDPLGDGGDAIVIQKTAEFTQGPAPLTGLFPTIPIAFSQTAATNVTHIVIEEEIITNSTGVDWTDFHMEVLDSGNAQFNPEATGNSGGGGPTGLSIDPFTQAQFSVDQMSLDIDGGVVENGAVWNPGADLNGGQLWIDVIPTGSTTFILKETPTPEPTTLSLLGLGGLLLRRKSVG